jgi:hypothetical protein
MRRPWVLFCTLLLAACGAPASSSPPHAHTAVAKPGPKSVGAGSSSQAAQASQAAPPIEDTPPGASAAEPPTGRAAGETRAEAAERVLFLATHLRTTELRRICPATLDEDRRVRCLVAHRYEDEPEARELALTLLQETGSLAGLLPEETTEDGRGEKVHLLPARPVGPNREHLVWVIAACRDYKRVLEGLSSHGPVTFRDRPVDFRFFYSAKGRMPSAFAATRNIGYNLYGAVNVSEDTVRDTLFHELFHLNDGWHGEWSRVALTPIYDRIVGRCGKRRACLSPYAPTDTLLGGTYYAFAPKGGVREYAAEVALRYYRENRLVLQGKPLPVRPFKCGPSENRQAWDLLAAEFFGGVDRTPSCSPEIGSPGTAP